MGENQPATSAGGRGTAYQCPPDKRLSTLEKEIRQSIRASYQCRAGEEWLQVCLRVLRKEARHPVRRSKSEASQSAKAKLRAEAKPWTQGKTKKLFQAA